MDDIERSRIQLKHWIDHNAEHLKGYEKVVQVLKQQGMTAPSEAIERGIKMVEAANAAFEEALSALPHSETAGSSGEAHEGHGHAHDHDHGHHHHSHDRDDS
jgi:rubrerythrin